MSESSTFEPKQLLSDISNWAWRNAPTVIGVTIAAALPSVIGFICGLAAYAFLNFYANGDKRADQNRADQN